MSQIVTVGGVPYTLPTSNDVDWGANFSLWAAAVSASVGATTNFVINARVPPYNAVGDGLTDDTVAINAAIAAGVSQGVPVYLPAGTYLVSLVNSLTTGVFPITANVHIYGDGMDATIIQCGAYTEAAGGIVFKKAEAVTDWKLEDVSIKGPATGTLTHAESVCEALYDIGGGGTTTWRRVRAWRFGNATIFMDELATGTKGGKLVLEECYIQGRGIGIFGNEGTDRDAVEWDLRDCRFEIESDWLPFNNGIGNQQLHCLYPNGGISFDIRGCQFIQAGGATGSIGVSHFGGAHALVPRYNRIANCHFGPLVKRGIVTHLRAVTEVVGCDFVGTSFTDVQISISGPVTITGCEFKWFSGSTGYCIIDDQGHAAKVIVQGCTFNEQSGAFGLYNIRCLAGTTLTPWFITACQFNEVVAGGSNIYANQGSVILDNCVFTATAGAACFRTSGGTHTVRQCVFDASNVAVPMILANTDANLTVNLVDNINWVGTTAPLLSPDGTHTFVINGKDNKFHETVAGKGDGFSISSTTLVSGDLQPGRGIGVYGYSAGVVSVNYNYDTYLIDEGGGPTVNTIHMLGAVAGANNNAFTTGVIKLYVKQAFTLGNAGNIVAAGGARTVATVVTLQYLHSLTKWVEV